MDSSSKRPGVWAISPESVGWERCDAGDTENYRAWRRPVLTEKYAKRSGVSGRLFVAGYDVMAWHRASDPSEDLDHVTAWIQEHGGTISAEGHLTEVPAGFFVVYRFREADRSIMMRGYLSVPGHLDLEFACLEFPYFHPTFSPDRPMTGLRFAHLTSRFYEEGRFRGTLSRDQHAELVRATDEECWDSEFPIDPISRVRRYLAEVRAQLANN